jgi:hypothetical protein
LGWDAQNKLSQKIAALSFETSHRRQGANTSKAKLKNAVTVHMAALDNNPVRVKRFLPG